MLSGCDSGQASAPLGKPYHSSSASDPSLRSNACPSLRPLRWVRAPRCRNPGSNLPPPLPRQFPPRPSDCCCPRWNRRRCNSRKGARKASSLQANRPWRRGTRTRTVASLFPWQGPSLPPSGGRPPPRWLPASKKERVCQHQVTSEHIRPRNWYDLGQQQVWSVRCCCVNSVCSGASSNSFLQL